MPVGMTKAAKNLVRTLDDYIFSVRGATGKNPEAITLTDREVFILSQVCPSADAVDGDETYRGIPIVRKA